MALVIVVGGGLAGLSAAHAALQRGASVLVVDKQPFLGGNSVKATSGINGALTKTQIRNGIADSPDAFLKDTAISAAGGDPNAQPSALNKVLAYNSAAAVEWLTDSFGLDLSLVSRLGGHSFPRTHRGKERFPGMTITYALMEKMEEISRTEPSRARVVTRARVTRLLVNGEGEVDGVEYVGADGVPVQEHGVVIIATGGYGADFSKDSILTQYRPDLAHLPTTNGDHCTGDGIKMALAIGASTVDLTAVQVHPTGLVHPDEPDTKLKFLAAEALRGCGALLLDRNGHRFCDELGRRDYVSGEMTKRALGPYRLVLNGAAAREIEWHCKHYCGRGLMRKFESGADVAKDMGITAQTLESTFNSYNEIATSKKDPFGKKYFHNTPFNMRDVYHVAVVTPVVHYCMGGLHVDDATRVCTQSGEPVKGLYAAGEVMGGVHGKNRLGGSSLLDCVVFGRVAGDEASKTILTKVSSLAAKGRLDRIAGHLTGSNNLSASINGININIAWEGAGGAPSASAAAPRAAASAAPAPAAPAAAAAAAGGAAAGAVGGVKKEYTLADVAKHNKDTDCWVVVNGQVLDVTSFLNDHPGGKQAIMLFAGRDASDEFNMLHKPDVVEKFAPQTIIGALGK